MPEYIVRRPYYYPHIIVIQIVNAVLSAVEFLLMFRLILEVFQASPASSFVAWVYAVTNSLMEPFAGAFSTLYIGNIPINLSAILAMIGYAIAAWIVIRLLSFLFSVFFQPNS